MQTLTNIVLDLHKPNYVRVTAKQYNDKSRIINVQVTDYGNLITLPEDMIARVKWHKPDGKGVFNDCDIYDNVIRVELTAEMLAAAGTAMAELILYQQESVVSTMAFSVEIYKSVVQDKDIISSDEFKALSSALISVDKCIRSCEENTEQLLEAQLSIEEDRENMNKLAEEINAKTSLDDFNEHVSDSNVHVTEEEKERWNTASTNISEASVKYAENAGTSELCTGNAATATALTTNAGSNTQPVYFSGGKPVACTSYANASVKYADSAGGVAWGNITGKPSKYPPADTGAYYANSKNVTVTTPTWVAGASVTVPPGTYIVWVSAYATGGSVRIGIGGSAGQWSQSSGGHELAQFVYSIKATSDTNLTTLVYQNYTGSDIIYSRIEAIRFV